jgi:hypothetical protein
MERKRLDAWIRVFAAIAVVSYVCQIAVQLATGYAGPTQVFLMLFYLAGLVLYALPAFFGARVPPSLLLYACAILVASEGASLFGVAAGALRNGRISPWLVATFAAVLAYAFLFLLVWNRIPQRYTMSVLILLPIVLVLRVEPSLSFLVESVSYLLDPSLAGGLEGLCLGALVSVCAIGVQLLAVSVFALTWKARRQGFFVPAA